MNLNFVTLFYANYSAKGIALCRSIERVSPKSHLYIFAMDEACFKILKSIELKSRPKDFVVGAKYVTEKDIVLLLTNRGNIKRMRPDEILKGKKNHVGKMYLKVVKSNMHNAINMDVIHGVNAKSSLAGRNRHQQTPEKNNHHSCYRYP